MVRPLIWCLVWMQVHWSEKSSCWKQFLEKWGLEQGSDCHVATSQRRYVPTSRRPNVATSPRRDVPTSRRPTSRRPHVATSPRRDVPTSRRPHVATSPRRDAPTSRHWVNNAEVNKWKRRDVSTSRRQLEICTLSFKVRMAQKSRGYQEAYEQRHEIPEQSDTDFEEVLGICTVSHCWIFFWILEWCF